MLWVLTILMVIYSYYDYIKDMLSWKTKPHLFSWMIFVILNIISVLVQYNAGAGPGVWSTISVTIGTIAVMLLSFKYWEKDIRNSDIISFMLAICTVILYLILSDPTYSMICVIIILWLAFYPTFRKTYHKPSQETLSMYVVAWVRSLIAILATTSLSFLTIGLPVYIIAINIFFVSMILIRKKVLWIN